MKGQTITLENNIYNVLELIGKGGQANIWKVKRQSDGAELALKSVLTFKSNKGRNEHLDKSIVDSRSMRLQSEIDFLKSLPYAETHFIVPCLDSGCFKDPNYGSLPAWVMPIYEKTLGGKMPPYPDDEPIPVLFSDCLKWMEQVAIALEATHSFLSGTSKFSHRDIKASNMMLTKEGDIRLIDFGIVRETNIDVETDTRSFSVESAAPEQVLPNSNDANKDAYAVGPHSDMYALGTVFYYFFTGKQPNAQIKLAKSSTFTKHIKILDEDNNGLIGVIGGLDDNEYLGLIDDIKFLFDEEYVDPEATRDTPTSGQLINSEHIPKSIASFIFDLLNPVFLERPSASEMLIWCRSLQDALTPELRELKLSTLQKKIPANSPVTIVLSMIGKGLPSDANWVKLEVDGKTVSASFDALASDRQHYGFVKAPQTSWTMTLPLYASTKFINICIEALIEVKQKQDCIKIEINESADSLWNKGKHQQALCLELREVWLNVLHQSCKPTIDDVTHCNNLLQSLERCHPDKKELIHLYQKKLEKKLRKQPSEISASELWAKGERGKALIKDLRDEWLDELLKSCNTKDEIEICRSFLNKLRESHPDKEYNLSIRLRLLDKKNHEIKTSQSPVNKNIGKKIVIPVLGVFLIIVSIFIYKIFYLKPVSIVENTVLLESELLGNITEKRENAWKQLNILSKRDNSVKAKKILDEFLVNTLELAKSTNIEKQHQAFPRLRLIAMSGNKKSMIALGEIYTNGGGGDKNWGLAWLWFHRSEAGFQKNALEDKANKILFDQASPQVLRNLAYQVVEQAARSEPTGHEPAQKWMAYRFKKGDGVEVDLEQAKKWDDIYNGIPVIGTGDHRDE